jgi:hypothetical protein
MRKLDYAVMLSTEMERSYHRNSVAVRHGIFLCAADTARELGSKGKARTQSDGSRKRDTHCMQECRQECNRTMRASAVLTMEVLHSVSR